MLSTDLTLHDERTSLRQCGLIPESNIPSLAVRWFHATGNPIHDPVSIRRMKATLEKPSDTTTKGPDNWVPFSKRDSIALEKAYQNNDARAVVSVNEDHMFQVNVPKRIISPVYWEGPTFEVRRATWFLQDSGSKWIPCEESMAEHIELGYCKHKPYLSVQSERPLPETKKHNNEEPDGDNDTSETSEEEKKLEATLKAAPVEKQWHLEDPYVNQYVVYTGSNTAWLLSNTMGSNIAKTIITRLTNRQNLGGTRLVRGYPEVEKETEKSPPASAQAKAAAEEEADGIDTGDKEIDEAALASKHEAEDYDNEQSEEEVRTIDHLIFVVHGIGQKMSERMGQNFVHDVNLLRKTIKSAFPIAMSTSSPSTLRQNGIQVLPILWRHEIKFGMASDDDEASETDLGAPEGEDSHPTLDEITPDGVPNIRMIVADVLLDIPLYMTPKYRDQMASVVTKEINRVYSLFIERNPGFKEKQGKVTVLGHSLGSLLAFDILNAQPLTESQEAYAKAHHSQSAMIEKKRPALDFPVHNFFALGSPLGIILLLKGVKIASRKSLTDSGHKRTSSSGSSMREGAEAPSASAYCYPAVENIYNLFHKSDPVAYRMEPLIARQYASNLKPVQIAYMKGGLKSVIEAGFNVGSGIATQASNMLNSFKTGIMRPFGGMSREAAEAVIDGEDGKNAARAGDDLAVREEIPLSTVRSSPSPSSRGAAKLALLNRTGRVDFCLQEGILENAYLSAFSVHLSYWQDLDVAGFLAREIYRE